MIKREKMKTRKKHMERMKKVTWRTWKGRSGVV